MLCGCVLPGVVVGSNPVCNGKSAMFACRGRGNFVSRPCGHDNPSMTTFNFAAYLTHICCSDITAHMKRNHLERHNLKNLRLLTLMDELIAAG